MSKGKEAAFVIAAMFCNIAIMGELIVTPIFYNIYAAFPGSGFVVNAIVAGPALMIVAGSLLATLLMKRLSNKKIIILGTVLFGVCGVASGLVSVAYSMLAMRLVYGIGTGFVNTSILALIAQVYDDGSKRASFLGIFNAVMAGIGAALGMVSGILATASWQNSFRLFWLGAPLLILSVFFLPEISPETTEKNSAEETPRAKKAPMGKTFWATLAAFTFFATTFGLFAYFASSYVAENSLGNEAFTGLLISVNTAGSFFCCLAFGLIYKKLKQGSAVLAYIFGVVGMILFWLFPGRALAIVNSALLGGFFGIALTYMYSYCPTIIPPERIGGSMGLITAAFGLAKFLAPYLVSALQRLLHTESITMIFGVGAAFSLAALVIQFATIAGHRNALRTIS
jgi:MFS family permease